MTDTTAGRKAAQEAVDIQQEIDRHEEAIKALKVRRDELLAEAIRAGLREHDGWTFGPVSSPKVASFPSLLAYNEDLADDYIEWYRDNMEIKTTATTLKAYAKARGMTAGDTDAMLGACLKEGDGDGGVRLRAPKEAGE